MTANNTCNSSSVHLDFNNTHPTATVVNPSLSKLVMKTPQLPQDLLVNSQETPPETAGIFDYLIWSAISLIIGGIILGIPPFLLSMLTRKYKRKANVKVAKTLSTIALILNVFVSFLAMLGLVYLITHFNNPY